MAPPSAPAPVVEPVTDHADTRREMAKYLSSTGDDVFLEMRRELEMMEITSSSECDAHLAASALSMGCPPDQVYRALVALSTAAVDERDPHAYLEQILEKAEAALDEDVIDLDDDGPRIRGP